MKAMKKAVIILACVLVGIALLYLFLIAPRMFNKPDMSVLEGYHYAHRGFFDNESAAPENSLAAFRAAVDAGYGIELDIQLSSDGVAMVFHDADLERMCGVEGKIWEYTCAELQKMKLLGTEETIPTFAETLALIDGQVPVIVEYKLDKVDKAVCAAGQALLSEYDGVYCIQCFHPLALMWYKQNAPEVIRGQLSQKYWEKEEYHGEALYGLLSYMIENVVTRPDYIAYEFDDGDNLSFKLCKAMGAKAAGWTLRSYEDYKVAKEDFDLYIFDSFALETE